MPKGRVVVGGKRWRGSRCQRSGAFSARCCKLQLGYCMRFLFLWACGVCVCVCGLERVQMFPCVCLHVLYIAVGQSCFECVQWPVCSMHVATSWVCKHTRMAMNTHTYTHTHTVWFFGGRSGTKTSPGFCFVVFASQSSFFNSVSLLPQHLRHNAPKSEWVVVVVVVDLLKG